MSSITVTGVQTINSPRGAVWAARAAAAAWMALSRWLADKPTGVESVGEEAAIEAARVRELARQYTTTDPGFAADLMAAADRHEAQHADR